MKLKMSFSGYFLPIILILLVSISLGKAQTRKLKIGDKFPDINLKGVLNYKDTTVNLTSLRGKVVILDIWSIWCSSCMEAMPHLQSLQDKFGDQIQIFTVNPFSSKKDVIETIQGNKVIKDLKLPCITDTLLNMNNFLRYNTIPTEIWIDKNGIIVGITHVEYVNETNVKALLEGKKGILRTKISEDFDSSNPLLTKANLLIQEPFYYSVLTKKIDGDDQARSGILALQFVKDTLRNTLRTLHVNATILALYNRAYMKEFPWVGVENRTVVETSDSSRFFYNRKRDGYQDAWFLNNQFCYEAVLPIDTSPGEYYNILRQDLNRYLNLNGRIESRNVSVWLIVKNRSQSRKPYVPSETKYKEHTSHYKSLKVLVQTLNQFSGIPFVNGVETTDVINVKIGYRAFSDMNEIKAILRSIGLDIIPTKKVLPMLVITEKRNQKQITK